MAKIKNAIIDRTYPITRKIYVHSQAPNEYLMRNLLATLPEWEKEQKFKNDMEVDMTDDWREYQVSESSYIGSGQSFDR